MVSARSNVSIFSVWQKYCDANSSCRQIRDAPRDFIDAQLRAIVGVELTIATVEAKEKLSQNRDAQDRAGTLEGLCHEPGPGPAAIADLMGY